MSVFYGRKSGVFLSCINGLLANGIFESNMQEVVGQYNLKF